MKTFFQIFCLVLISSVVVTDSYVESYRVRGEVYYENGQDKWTRSITSGVISEVPIILEQGGQIISFVFIVEPPPSDKYSLTVSLLTNPKSADGFSTKGLTQIFQSRLVGGKTGHSNLKWNKTVLKLAG